MRLMRYEIWKEIKSLLRDLKLEEKKLTLSNNNSDVCLLTRKNISMKCSNVFHHWVAVEFAWYMITIWHGHFQLFLQEKWQKFCCELHHTSPTYTALSTVGLSYQCVLRSCISESAHLCVCVCVCVWLQDLFTCFYMKATGTNQWSIRV